MTEPAEVDPTTTVRITLGGRVCPIPLLAWRDLKKCRKELLELTALINNTMAATAFPILGDDDARAAHNMSVMSGVFQDISNDDFDRLVMGPVYVGVVAGQPAVSRDEFDSWPLTEAERQMAWLTVRQQSGMFVVRDASGTGGSEPGEAGGVTQPPK